jgi:hypothetical protein
MLGQDRQAIKSLIIGPPSFLCLFFKFQKKTRKMGYPGRVRGCKNRLRAYLNMLG